MVANRSVDTAPEIRLRSLLHRAGARFRKNHRIDAGDLRVRPDVVFPARRLAVFVDGCFWHRCPTHGSDPLRNGEFWKRKLDANVARDRRVDTALAASGWTVMRFWEHVPAEVSVAEILDFLSAGVDQ